MSDGELGQVATQFWHLVHHRISFQQDFPLRGACPLNRESDFSNTTQIAASRREGVICRIEQESTSGAQRRPMIHQVAWRHSHRPELPCSDSIDYDLAIFPVAASDRFQFT